MRPHHPAQLEARSNMAQGNTATLLDAQPDAESPAESMALATTGLAAVVERLAANPDVDVVKLEKIIELQERIIKHNAKAAFDAAFAVMAPHIPEINEKGQIAVRGSVRSTYARLEDIHEAVKPICAQHGFAVRHRTEWPADKPGVIRIVGILSHREGHSEESAFEAPMDKSEFRTDVQSQGSTVSYGRRYTTLDLLNISTRAQDDDGQKAGRQQPPRGYEDWWFELMDAGSKGTKALDVSWGAADAAFKNYTVQHNKGAWEELKRRAAAVKP